MISVYGLVDPRNSELRYIGKSVKPTERLTTHIREARGGSVLHSRRWISGLLSDGLKPDLFIIETCADNTSANEAECFWIASMRAVGCDLTNRTIGGDGQPRGYRPTPEVAQKISAKNRGMKRTEEQKARLRLAFNTPEERARRSEATKTLARTSPEWLGKVRHARTGKKNSEETNRRISAAWTPERKAKHAAEKSALPVDDRWRQQLSAALKSRWDKYRARKPKNTHIPQVNEG